MAQEEYVNVRKNKFTQVGNSLLWDKAVTLQAKGLLTIFLSNSGDWKLNMREVFGRSKNGRDAQYKIVDELIKHGYFARVELREGGKFVKMVYLFSDDKADVTEYLKQFAGNPNAIINPDKKKKKSVDTVDNSPLPENQDTVNNSQKPFPENQDTDIQDTDSSDTVNQDNNNTNLNYTKENNTKVNNINQSIDSELNDISNNEMPMLVKKQISVNQKRLIDDNISVIEILSFYSSTENTVIESDFAVILGNVLKKTKGKINNFHAVMKKAITNWSDEYQYANDETAPTIEETSYERKVPFYNWLEN
ncbi:hypothetical protein QFZ31_006652 [Neobacillus niacini]|uniref:hypothetical protein n=1 Tax=Neobacillus driksii TaxID=3035913 RepID=UPI00278965C9|nr:hypothetical protein [Neobacillus niacini]MDQ0976600.1 hypothetical protein [Neobacillus niacini]